MRKSVRSFRRSESGGITVLSLFLFIATAVVMAAGIDIASLFSKRTQLQVASDATAHAALYYREVLSREDAIEKALDVALDGMPRDVYGNVIDENSIQFGYWDHTSQTFTPDPDSRDAVMVETMRSADRGNAVAPYLFQFVGLNSFDVAARSVFETYRPLCFREGFVGDGVVDIQSNNSYFNGFCIHSNTHVSINSNNFFEPGTIVSMPRISDLELPNSGFKTNEGLEAALRTGTYRLRVLEDLPKIYEDLTNGQDDSHDLEYGYMPDYIKSHTEIRRPKGNKLDETDFESGYVHVLGCKSGKVQLSPKKPNNTLKEMVIVTDCAIQFGQEVHLEDVVIFTTDTGAKSIYAPSSLYVGRDDSCAEGGGAQILTYGGMDFASDLHLYGGQLLAEGDIAFAANAYGIKGASMVARGEIDGTSNMNMGFCLTGMEDNFEADYFRLAL